MRRTAYRFANVFDGTAMHENAALLVEDGRCVGIVDKDAIEPGTASISMDNLTAAPGYVDLQVNGGGGVQFNQKPDLDSIREICAAHLRLGTTSTLVTLITDTDGVRAKAIAAAAEATQNGIDGFLGLHLEGPHLSIDRKGAHRPELIRPMQDVDIRLMESAVREMPVLLMTVAAESATVDQIRNLAAAGILVSLGHTDCSFATANEYTQAGVTMVTHLFNAMSALGHREPGLVGACLSNGELSAGLIADGVHVQASVIQIALLAKQGPGKIFLVSDAMAPAGTTLTEFTLNDRTIRRAGNRLQLEDGTLAGADTDMAASVRYLCNEVGISRATALAMATSIPASVAGVGTRKGNLRAGADADFVALDESLHVRAVWVAGRQISSFVPNRERQE